MPGVAALTLAVMLSGTSRASANPIGFQFSSMLDYGVLAGTPVWGTVIWDDTGPGQMTAPILSMSLNIGSSHHYGLSSGLSGSYVQSPHLDPLLGFAGDWGPNFEIHPGLLFGGLTSFSLFEGGNVFVAYSYLQGSSLQYLTQASGSVVNVPEPGSLFFGLSGLCGLLLVMRRRLRTGGRF